MLTYKYNLTHCKVGLLVPKWQGDINVSIFDRFGRSLLYIWLIVYVFIGIGMTCDRLMTAIEALTSEDKPVVFNTREGTKRIIYVGTWNKTVANMTLMAMGASSPAIILTLLELFQKDFQDGELGTGIIIGSAAFNLFIILAVCIMAVPINTDRMVIKTQVIIVAAISAFFGYFWLYIIVRISSPGIIALWEAILTVIIFPIFIAWAFLADRHYLCYKYQDPLYGSDEYDLIEGLHLSERFSRRSTLEATIDEIREFEDRRREYISLVKTILRKKPNEELEIIEAQAIRQLTSKQNKSRAYYRLLATNYAFTGNRGMLTLEEHARKLTNEANRESQLLLLPVDAEIKIRIFFEKSNYEVQESAGFVRIDILRAGNISASTTVQYETDNGTAMANIDYVPSNGSLTFLAGMERQKINIEIMDNEIYENDAVFYVKLKNPSPPAILEIPYITSIVILDDEHAGVFSFTDSNLETTEGIKNYFCKVIRYSGSRGSVIVPYWTENGTAINDEQYTGVKGELIFNTDETELIYLNKFTYKHTTN